MIYSQTTLLFKTLAYGNHYLCVFLVQLFEWEVEGDEMYLFVIC